MNSWFQSNDSQNVRSCSGTGAPRIGLLALGLWVDEIHSADTKASCLQLCRALGQVPTHHFSEAKDLEIGGGMCHVHECHCFAETEEDHLFISGFPCQPFSQQRPKRWTQRWKDHPAAATMFDTARVIRARQPRLVLLENVPGFLYESRTGSLTFLLFFFALVTKLHPE